MKRLVEVSRSFRALNTDIEVILCVDQRHRMLAEAAVKRTHLLFETVEETLSRFKPESELSRLNFSTSPGFKASPMLFDIVQAALKAARTTEGIFDPTILPCLLAAGYDRSFENLEACGDIPRPNIGNRTRPRWQDIRLDPESLSIFMPQGIRIDLGGIGKGWTVDRASDGLEFFSNYAVDAGGDIRVRGKQVDGSSWTIGVANPFVEGLNLTTVELSTGAVCTSTTTRRKWKLEGKVKHHLIDPRSGEPSKSGVVSATVVAESAARAEVISKTAIILGIEAGLQFIESQSGASGLLVNEDGEILRSMGFKEVQYVA